MKSTSFVMNFVMLAIFVVMVVVASHYPAQSRFMPFVVGFPAIALCLLQIFLDVRAARRPKPEFIDMRSEFERAEAEVSRLTGRHMEFEVAHTLLPAAEAPAVQTDTVRREIVLWAYFLGLIAGVLFFGFWITLPIFITAFLRQEAELSWRRALILGIAATAILYVVFERTLHASLHPGFITERVVDLF